MPTEVKVTPIPLGKVGLEGGVRRYNGTTWHTSEPYRHGDLSAEGREQDCFEVYWDAEVKEE